MCNFSLQPPIDMEAWSACLINPSEILGNAGLNEEERQDIDFDSRFLGLLVNPFRGLYLHSSHTQLNCY